jgi:hypothetical protein
MNSFSRISLPKGGIAVDGGMRVGERKAGWVLSESVTPMSILEAQKRSGPPAEMRLEIECGIDGPNP